MVEHTRYDGLSPAQWLYRRRQITEAVAIPKAYERITDNKFSEHEAQRERKMEKGKTTADQASCPLKPMKPGDTVYVQDLKSAVLYFGSSLKGQYCKKAVL